MARNLRIEYEGAVYHVMSRGNRREAIFRDDKDREMFLATLATKSLEMGNRSNVSRAVGALRQPKDGQRKRLKKTLHICTDFSESPCQAGRFKL